jgi:hypothetical protein
MPRRNCPAAGGIRLLMGHPKSGWLPRGGALSRKWLKMAAVSATRRRGNAARLAASVRRMPATRRLQSPPVRAWPATHELTEEWRGRGPP